MTQLPQLHADLFLADGGAETTLIFDDGIDLPYFAAFPLLDDPDGRAALTRYFERYAGIAERDGTGIVLETATWRANPDWAARRGYDGNRLDRVNRAAVDMLLDVRAKFAATVVISGCVGPRGDAYRPETIMSRDEAREYHSTQIRTLADTEADLVTAMTLTNVPEATGIADAAREAGAQVVISFTVETDGRLPRGDALGDAVRAVDEDTNGYRKLRERFPRLTVLGGCCGTDHRHVDAISRAFSG
ncbi:homocysteine S-methyltransferase family protein [Lentzea albida]|uniref:Homocysteine S-methyltransferase n=1 Tax=Lentzea albida TaxID=65499 RepID=A0A1H9VE65_9PSEU|nr:homocysteine S-methyltransferase family protein [Lentzea albida]SES19724.1 Homocysteine S-methyltransferase [Lentzea albida]